MQITSIPQKALSLLLSRRGSSNRYPLRPAEKNTKEEGKSVFLRKLHINGTGNYDAKASDYRKIWFALVTECQVVPLHPPHGARSRRDESEEPKRGVLHAPSPWKENTGHRRRTEGWGWSKYQPTPVRSKASDPVCIRWCNNEEGEETLHPNARSPSTDCVGISPPCSEQRLLTRGDGDGKACVCFFFFGDWERFRCIFLVDATWNCPTFNHTKNKIKAERASRSCRSASQPPLPPDSLLRLPIAWFPFAYCFCSHKNDASGWKKKARVCSYLRGKFLKKPLVCFPPFL